MQKLLRKFIEIATFCLWWNCCHINNWQNAQSKMIISPPVSFFFLVFVSVCTSPTCTEYSGIRTPNEMIIFDFTSFDSFPTILLIIENALIDQFFIDYAHHSNSNKEKKMHSHSNELVITFFCSVCKCKCAKTFNHISKKKNRSKFFIFSSSNKKAKFGLREEEKKKTNSDLAKKLVASKWFLCVAN